MKTVSRRAVAVAAVLAGLGAGLTACTGPPTPACPGFRAAAIWNVIGSSPSWLQYYDAAAVPLGRTAIQVEGMSHADQTPVHHGGKILLASIGNIVKDKTHLITFEPATCTARPVRIDVQSPLNVTTMDDGALVFNWLNGWAQLHRIDSHGKEAGLFQLNDWVGLTGLTVTDDAVYVIANYGEEKKAYLLVLDRDDLHEVKRVLLPQIVSDDGPSHSALVGSKLYFPADRHGDDSATDTALGVVDVKTFATDTVDLGVASPYIVRAVGTKLYIAHTTLNFEGHELSVLDTTTGRLVHRDVGFLIGAMDANETTVAVAGYSDLDLKDPRLAIYQLPGLARTADAHVQPPDPDRAKDSVLINVFVP